MSTVNVLYFCKKTKKKILSLSMKVHDKISTAFQQQQQQQQQHSTASSSSSSYSSSITHSNYNSNSFLQSVSSLSHFLLFPPQYVHIQDHILQELLYLPLPSSAHNFSNTTSASFSVPSSPSTVIYIVLYSFPFLHSVFYS